MSEQKGLEEFLRGYCKEEGLKAVIAQVINPNSKHGLTDEFNYIVLYTEKPKNTMLFFGYQDSYVTATDELVRALEDRHLTLTLNVDLYLGEEREVRLHMEPHPYQLQNNPYFRVFVMDKILSQQK